MKTHVDFLSGERYLTAGLLSPIFSRETYARAFRTTFDEARHESATEVLDTRAQPR